MSTPDAHQKTNNAKTTDGLGTASLNGKKSIGQKEVAPGQIKKFLNPTPEPAPEPDSNLTGLDNPTLAFNLSSVADWSPGLQFLDLMKIARSWIGHEPDQWGGMQADDLKTAGVLDAAGWPTSIPDNLEKIGTLWQWNSYSDSVEHRAGVYVVDYEGEGDLRVEGDVQILSNEDGQMRFHANGGNIFLNIYDTDPKGTGDYLRNITVVKEENIPLFEAGAIFNPKWLQLIDDARELRFMDWMQTNRSDLRSWEERVTPDSAPSDMVAIEHMVQLANEVGADAWFTIPHQADEAFIRNFAIYVRDNLDPNLKAKVEYSNEVWNWAFQQTHWLLEQSQQEWGVKAHIDYHAKKAVEVALIWENVFGDEADARLINVLGTHTVNSWTSERLLDPVIWQENEPDTYVDPASVFEELAVTTYFGSPTVAYTELRTDLIEKIRDPDVEAMAYLFEKLQDPDYAHSIPQIHEYLLSQAAVAAEFGLDLTAYEGGQHVHHSFAVRDLTANDVELLNDFMIAFVRSPYMAELYSLSWQSWMEVSDGAYMQYSDMTQPSKWGSWGTFENFDSITARAETLIDLNETTTPWWNDAEGGTHYQSGITVIGSNSDNTMRGTSQEDYLIGFEGNDVFYSSTGKDGINGGAGIDRVIYTGEISDYAIHIEGDGYRIESAQSSDYLLHIEEIVFEDGIVLRLDELDLHAKDVVASNLQLPEVSPELPEVSPELPEVSPELPEVSPELPEVSPELPEVSPELPEVPLSLSVQTGMTIMDINSNGYDIRAINPWSAVGKELGLNVSGETVFAVVNTDVTAELMDTQITANYWTLNENRVDRDGEALTDNPVDALLALGGIHIATVAIAGSDGADRMFGRSAGETFFGGAGDDVLIGRSGNDNLSGGAGNDWISGGSDNDVLTGGTGSDRFIFVPGDGDDIITDLGAEDWIELRGFLGEDQNRSSALTYDGTSLIVSNGFDTVHLANTTQDDMSWVYDQIILS